MDIFVSLLKLFLIRRYNTSYIIHKLIRLKSKEKIHMINSMCWGPLVCSTVTYPIKVQVCLILPYYRSSRICSMTCDDSLGVYQCSNHLRAKREMVITMIVLTTIMQKTKQNWELWCRATSIHQNLFSPPSKFSQISRSLVSIDNAIRLQLKCFRFEKVLQVRF